MHTSTSVRPNSSVNGVWPAAGEAGCWSAPYLQHFEAVEKPGFQLSGGIQKWSVKRYKRLLDIETAPPAGLYRIVTDEGDGRTWLATPDYQRVAAFKKPAVDPKRLVEALRAGRGKLCWPPADT